jgi:hypothetical protein
MASVKQRLLTVIALLPGLMAFGSAKAQQGRSDSESVRCAESLEIPKYPPLARSARLAGAVHVHAMIVHRSATQITVDGAHPILRTAVETSLSNSEFSSSCDKRGIDLVFIFRIEGSQTATHDTGTVKFGWPNEFTISVRPPIPQP